ncbi:MAG: helix-hairpin-helix domain-containing protein [Candidatus Pacearchaeota archaeon]|nr:helix-hairpin-helix domain-containing protein [Candidatus Pacearchaeota archaeon]
MKQIFNIFSKKNPTKKIIEKIKIIADYREKNCLVASELIEYGIGVEFRELKVADYIVKDVAIERKTISDFISSMINHRLIKQLEELQQYENKLLIIEGIEEHEIYNDDNERVHANSIRGFLLSILLKHKIPIIFTKNYQDTAKFISVLARRKEKEMPLNVTKKSLNKKERLQFILESFPGIGPKTARKLLEKFKTVKNIVNASIEELKKIIGKKAEVFKLINEEF